MIDRLWRVSYRSLTIAWSYALAAIGLWLEVAPILADILPGVADYVPPAWAGRYTLAIAIITFAARMRTIRGAE